jgi:hypothetical protein
MDDTRRGCRRGLLLAGVVSLALVFAGPQAARALQFYFFFEIPYSVGGTGGQYFTGSPRYKLYDCRVCHVGAPGQIRVHLWTEPVDIFQSGYRAGETYTVHLELEKELRSPPQKFFSTNNFCVEVLDRFGRNAGTFDLGYPWNRLTQLFDPTVLSPDGTTVLSGFFYMDLHWSWFWRAPEEAGRGSVVFYGGFVDGNGDLKAFGDDVAVFKKEAKEMP